MSLLEQDIIRKKWVDKNVTQLEFDVDNKKEYKVEEIRDSAVYARVSKRHLSGLYDLIS